MSLAEIRQVQSLARALGLVGKVEAIERLAKRAESKIRKKASAECAPQGQTPGTTSAENVDTKIAQYSAEPLIDFKFLKCECPEDCLHPVSHTA